MNQWEEGLKLIEFVICFIQSSVESDEFNFSSLDIDVFVLILGVEMVWYLERILNNCGFIGDDDDDDDDYYDEDYYYYMLEDLKSTLDDYWLLDFDSLIMALNQTETSSNSHCTLAIFDAMLALIHRYYVFL